MPRCNVFCYYSNVLQMSLLKSKTFLSSSSRGRCTLHWFWITWTQFNQSVCFTTMLLITLTLFSLKDIANNALCGNVGGSLQDILIYFIALSCKDLQRKQLLMKCIHINPSEIKFWNALRNLWIQFSHVRGNGTSLARPSSSNFSAVQRLFKRFWSDFQLPSLGAILDTQWQNIAFFIAK